MDREKLSRKQRDKLRHREEILDTALTLFSSKGFHNVSMQEIANDSEFGMGTLYAFFQSKEALFEELMDNTGEQVLDELSKILDGPGNEAERLIGFLRHQPQLQQQHGQAIKLIVSEFGVQGSKLSKVRDQHDIHEKLDSSLVRIIKEGVRKGIFRSVDPGITAKAITATTQAIIFIPSGVLVIEIYCR